MLKWVVSGGSGGKGGTPCTSGRTTPISPHNTEVNNNDNVDFGRLPPLPAHHTRRRDCDMEHCDRFIKGSDPLYQTARGKLQSRRSRLNEQINRELRLRSGAENLLKATNNKKLCETISMELSSVNSNLQLLKEELADVNSSVDIYQGNNNCTQCIPMIPLGLKETKDLDFLTPFKKFLSDHYFENGESYHRSIENIQAIRQACRTPVRSEEGIDLLFKYYNHLYFIEKRFFSPQKHLGIFFEWYDSLTGVPSCQKTVGFEKGSILFNIGALYTQIGARQDRSAAEGLQLAVESFQKAAGAFKYLRDHFTHAPSRDMQAPMLDMLMKLMLAQSQECEFELRLLRGVDTDLLTHITQAHEAAMVSELYKETQTLMTVDSVSQHTPAPWVALVQSKALYYRALSHYHTAISVLHHTHTDDMHKLAEHFDNLHVWNPNRKFEDSVASKPPKDREERVTFAKAHLRQAILANEDALRIHNQSRQLRKIDTFHDVLRTAHDRSLLEFSSLEEEDDFTELDSAPAIHPKSQNSAVSIVPDFSLYKVEDMFFNLGPITIFSARHTWTAPRIIQMKKTGDQEFGFSIRGDSPVIIAAVEAGSLAQKCGLKVGDFISGVNETDARWCKHEETVALIRQAGSQLKLILISPLDKNFLDLDGPVSPLANQGSVPPTPNMSLKTQGSESGKDKHRHGHRKSASGSSGSGWTLRRKRSSSKDKSQSQLESDKNGIHSR